MSFFQRRSHLSSICNALELAERVAFGAVFLLVASVNVQTEWTLWEYLFCPESGPCKGPSIYFCFVIS